MIAAVTLTSTGFNHHMPHFTGVVRMAAVHVAIHDDARAQARANIQINKGIKMTRHAVKAFANRRDGGIILQRHRQSAHLSETRSDIDVLPAVQRGRPH